jgi:hypothetical protein
MRATTPTVLTLVLASAASDAQTTGIAVSPPTSVSASSSVPPPARLSSGTYKFAGRCAKMTVFTQDLTSDCGTYLGIVAKDPDRPLFIIPRRDSRSAWQYQVTTPGVLSEDGKVMTYKISSMIDMAASLEASREYLYPGECVNSVRIGEPLLRCTMWRDEKRTEVTREVVFEGNGNWLFDRSSPGT